MQDSAIQRMTPPAIVGGTCTLISLTMIAYYRSLVQYADSGVGTTILVAGILIGLVALIGWAYGLYHYATGKGQSAWWAAGAVVGPLALLALYFQPDLNPAHRKRYANRGANRPAKSYVHAR